MTNTCVSGTYASGPPEPSAAIKVVGLSKAYTSGLEVVQAVDDVDLLVREGEFVCLLGASGSGKTTLLSLLAGLESADRGDIEVAGACVSRMSRAERADLRLRHVGVVYQDNNLIEEFTALENVALPLEVVGMHRDEIREQARLALRRVDLHDLDDRWPRHMSGGQRQRVGIARALVGKRSVLLADWPCPRLVDTGYAAV